MALRKKLLQARRAMTFKIRMWNRRRLAGKYLFGEGIEVGALHLPLDVPDSVVVHYLDRITTSELRAKDPDLRDAPLVDVELIDNGESLGSIVDESLDFVIANHMIEHTEDPIGTISNFLRVLRPDGVVYMAVPDKRRTFDRNRPITSVEHVVRDHLEGPSRSRISHYQDWVRFIDEADPADVPRLARYAAEHGLCIHFHVWTPAAFKRLLVHCRDRLDLPLQIEEVGRNLSEFIIVFRKRPLPSGPAPRAGRGSR
jgi:SAM-dependent methyltransferase